MISPARLQRIHAAADTLTARHPPGTPCRFWPGAKNDGPGRESKLRSAFGVSPAGELVVWVEGHPGWIAATHVECGGEWVVTGDILWDIVPTSKELPETDWS